MDIRGLEIADLREVSILRNLSDEERSTIKSVHVYGSNRSPFDPSALYVTTNDEVFLLGFDSMVGKSSVEEVSNGRRGFLDKSKKVEELSGKSVRRIVVGEEFGAALTKDNDLYMWGRDVGRQDEHLPAQVKRFAVKRHEPGSACQHCRRGLTLYSGISYCGKCKLYGTGATLLSPHSSCAGATLMALGYLESSAPASRLPQLYCTECRTLRGSTSLRIELVDQKSTYVRIQTCSFCRTLIDPIIYIPPRNNCDPRKITFTSPLSIVDITAGRNFLLIQTSSELIIWGELRAEKYNEKLNISDSVAVAKVACGSDHIAAITAQGDLYTYGEYGADRTSLNKVPLTVPAVDVACGSTSTVCLLNNGTCLIRGKVVKVVTGFTFSMNLFHSTYRCIPAVLSQNYAKVIESSLIQLNQSVDKRSAELTGDPTDVFIYLHGTTLTSPDGKLIDKVLCVREKSEPTDEKIIEDQNSSNTEYLGDGTKHELHSKNAGEENPCGVPAHQISNLDLFGQQHLSDLTLKLADGNMPVHRSVLHSSSSYFKQFFSESNTSAVVDMSSYNPSAYRGFLQYLYGAPMSEMKCEDMVDVYVLATSYKDDWIAADVFSKLKSSINPDNVLLLLDKAKAVNSTELEQECLKFINAPEFKKSLWESASENIDILTDILRSLSSSKN